MIIFMVNNSHKNNLTSIQTHYHCINRRGREGDKSGFVAKCRCNQLHILKVTNREGRKDMWKFINLILVSLREGDGRGWGGGEGGGE